MSGDRSEKEKEALQSHWVPLVHQCWKPLVRRCQESNDEVMIIKALECMQVLASECGAFMRDKFIKELWPIMQQTLVQHYLHQSNPSIHNTLQMELTASYRVQEAILKTLASIGREVKRLPIDFMEGILRTIFVYLDPSTCSSLQVCAQAVFTQFLSQNSDLCWLVWGSLSQTILQPPSSLFSPISFPPFHAASVWNGKLSPVQVGQIIQNCRGAATQNMELWMTSSPH